MLRILSLGAGVQSTTVLLMSIKGELPKLDCAIFADTGWEPREVYDHLDCLTIAAERAGCPVHRVKAGDLRDKSIRGQVRGRKADGQPLPLYVSHENGQGMIKRQCTTGYKIVPIEKFIKREILGLKPHQRAPKEAVVEQWYGISADEAQRMRTSPEAWKVNEYPLCGHAIDYLGRTMTRQACLDWLSRNWPYPVPRSSCLGCPYHSNAEWKKIKANPEYWRDVTEFDRAIRHSGGMRGEVFLHRSLKPLEEVDLSTAEDHGQLNMFGNECQGMCGV